MITEQLIRQNEVNHQQLLREAAKYRMLNAGKTNEPSALASTLARTGDLLVTVGQGLQRRYRRGVTLTEYNGNSRLGQAL